MSGFHGPGQCIQPAPVKEADPDHYGSLTKDENLDLVEKLFNAADTGKDGTLTAKDLNSKAGRALLRLIQPLPARNFFAIPMKQFAVATIRRLLR